jgi:hypothetical protein
LKLEKLPALELEQLQEQQLGPALLGRKLSLSALLEQSARQV